MSASAGRGVGGGLFMERKVSARVAAGRKLTWGHQAACHPLALRSSSMSRRLTSGFPGGQANTETSKPLGTATRLSTQRPAAPYTQVPSATSLIQQWHPTPCVPSSLPGVFSLWPLTHRLSFGAVGCEMALRGTVTRGLFIMCCRISRARKVS